MPIATGEQYRDILDRAGREGFALPAINVTSSQTLNAALQGFADADSDGIIQVSVGTAHYLSGARVKDRLIGSRALALYAHEVAKAYPVTIALHTDHCPAENLGDWVRPLLADAQERRAQGAEPLFQSHMWDGSALPLADNLRVAAELLELASAVDVLLEVEIGIVGGEEDGIAHAEDVRMYSTVDDARSVIAALGHGDRGRYLTAFAFGNVHGVYNPDAVRLRPELLGEIQSAIGQDLGTARPFDLVFHGGSGSTPEQIASALAHGVIKMNIDTDTQYAFSRSIAGHMLSNWERVLKVDGGFGDKKAYDPRAWGVPAEQSMAERVVEAAVLLGSAGQSLR